MLLRTHIAPAPALLIETQTSRNNAGVTPVDQKNCVERLRVSKPTERQKAKLEVHTLNIKINSAQIAGVER
jgi:hypothetical protein